MTATSDDAGTPISVQELALPLATAEQLREVVRELWKQRDSLRAELQAANERAAAAESIIATWKRFRIERPSGCACELDEAGEQVLKWCAAHAALIAAANERAATRMEETKHHPECGLLPFIPDAGVFKPND